VSGTDTVDRDAFLAHADQELQSRSQRVDALLAAFEPEAGRSTTLADRLRSMRHKRDVALTKLTALHHHRSRGWESAKNEFRAALQSLADSWRVVITTLPRAAPP
tara:strand:- start:1010 stop:1324 length:315 start_codon:yes stop_codon:yes gene_type:complete